MDVQRSSKCKALSCVRENRCTSLDPVLRTSPGMERRKEEERERGGRLELVHRRGRTGGRLVLGEDVVQHAQGGLEVEVHHVCKTRRDECQPPIARYLTSHCHPPLRLTPTTIHDDSRWKGDVRHQTGRDVACR
ncbi:hypothetical protein C0Q70_10947 [Pomacea canaliculata]|uniref:Uncharacterized protein n=1 Tax=Pomacea canaliculata TaxID=400727 RepID=A0A2T7P4M0_POMCA|nr:hypothetical protein C0Q70_10947 [Pomacea canaliculata]